MQPFAMALNQSHRRKPAGYLQTSNQINLVNNVDWWYYCVALYCCHAWNHNMMRHLYHGNLWQKGNLLFGYCQISYLQADYMLWSLGIIPGCILITVVVFSQSSRKLPDYNSKRAEIILHI